MPALLLPTNFEDTVTSGIDLPETLVRYRLTSMPVVTKRKREVTYWEQAVSVNGFVMGQQFLMVKDQATLSHQVKEASAILYYVLKGNVLIQTSSGSPESLNEQDYCLLVCPANYPADIHFYPGQYHLVQLSFSLHLLYHLPGFHADLIRTIEESGDEVQLVPPVLTLTKLILSIWNSFLLNSRSLIQPDFLRLNDGCLRLLTRFVTDRTTMQQQQAWKERKELRIEELPAYLADHLDVNSRQLTTEHACAKKLALSIYQFRKLWKDRYAISLTRYLLQTRMEKARQLFSRKEQTPASIFLQVGYQDFSSFSRAFSRWYGFPPSRLDSQNG